MTFLWNELDEFMFNIIHLSLTIVAPKGIIIFSNISALPQSYKKPWLLWKNKIN